VTTGEAHPHDAEFWAYAEALYQQRLDEAIAAYLLRHIPLTPPRRPLPAAPTRPVGPQPLRVAIWSKQAWEAVHPL
jgi:hypothetical protein